MSLWGGDAVFNKLDLRLNVIENLTNIPVTFKSGVIHELRIHVIYFIVLFVYLFIFSDKFNLK